MLAPGETVRSPKAFVGIYHGDLDEAGNACLDWQYRYMWDYAREGWFPAIRMLGYWWKGTGWRIGQYTGYQDVESTFRKVLRVADLIRYCGGDVYHRDWGWWDRMGDWNGPDWRAVNEYLSKSGIGMLIYLPFNHVAPGSRVDREHHDLLTGNLLEISKPEAVEVILNLLDRYVKKWGPFQLRQDGGITVPVNGDETPQLAQDQAFRDILRRFLDDHPDCAFQACNGGGSFLGYEYVSYASTIQMTDGAAGILSNYYISLLFPPDRTCHMPDSWNPNDYDRATWRGLLSLCFDMTGDTWDPAKLEGLRVLIDIYHYLYSQGVVGRWVRVYRPVVTGDDPTMYFQRLSGDRQRGIIVSKHAAPGPVNIKPKGLIAGDKYNVSFQESDTRADRTGADLMLNGFSFDILPPGELIYLNLPMHPGSKLDTIAPAPPRAAVNKSADNLDYPGVEITWKRATDNNWISYYEIMRDGAAIDKVAKGAYYFDHSAGADPAAKYEVRTVDGAGNVSSPIAASGPEGPRASVYDDAPGQAIGYQGDWEHQKGLQPAHRGTISATKQKGAVAKFAGEGRRLRVFAKLGADCGRAAVSIDGGAPETIDTYSADDIWGACVFDRQFDSSGPHTIRIEVLGEKDERSTDVWVHIDGVRVEH
jgi:hypothetical protein